MTHLNMDFQEFKAITTSMNYTQVNVFLDERLAVIGSGAHRKVFQLSNDVVIKLDLQDHIRKVRDYKFKFLKSIYPKSFNNAFTENHMEVEKYHNSKNCDIFKFMPNYIGSVQLADGTLLVAWELIKDYNGNISQGLNNYLTTVNQKMLINSFNEFKTSLLLSKQQFHSLSPDNLLVQKISPTNSTIKLIDFGSWQDLSVVPIAAFSQRVYRSKVKRRLKKISF